jgi:molybdenum cofactor cytidylyltransferase
MTGLIILAAGESSRLGKPKQNLLYGGKTLLQHAVTTVINSVCDPVIVVLGAYTEIIMPEIGAAPVQIIHNANWHEGMSSSIRLGITELQKTPGINSAIIMLCDQPFVDVELINQLLQQHQQSRKGIIACAYNNTLGVPVLFQQKYFAELLALKGHDGAKKLLSAYADDIASVDFPKGAVDIDTMDDYEGLVG